MAGANAAELQVALKGFSDDEEAAWYIDLTRGALRQACSETPPSNRLTPSVLLTDKAMFFQVVPSTDSA